MSSSDQLLIKAIRDNYQPPKTPKPDPKKKAAWNEAWDEFHKRYHGRLQAYIRRRLRDQTAVDDTIQNTFVGFQNSLVNYDERRDLQTWLFTIASHKVTDYIRQSGRRRDQTSGDDEEKMDHTPDSRQRTASADARSAERIEREAASVGEALTRMIEEYKRDGQFTKVMVLELLFVKGWGNNDVAAFMKLPDQTIANIKHQTKERLRTALANANQSPTVFPELDVDTPES
jgi:RNA polymerase sigma-70 factor (ECF subfamily)